MGTINEKLQYLAETKAQLEDVLLDKGITPSSDFRENVGLVETYTTDATATTNDIINPKTAYVDGEKIAGAIIPTYEPSTDLQSKSLTNTTGMDIYDIFYEKGYALVGNRGSSSFYVSKIVDNIILLIIQLKYC